MTKPPTSDISQSSAAAGAVLPIGPRPLPVKFSCTGCPALRTEQWTDHLDNDERDSGTSARCHAAGDKSITAYWHDGSAPPAWCPATPQPPPEAGSVGVPEGFVLVPKVATDAMVSAAIKLQGDDAFAAKAPALASALDKIYRAMLSAAPAPKECRG